MTVESSTQAICDLALRFGEGDEESMVSFVYVITPPPEHKKINLTKRVCTYIFVCCILNVA
jgi:hypothetical protein